MNTNDDNSNAFNIDKLPYSYAKKNKINFELIEPKIRKIVKKSYADNFTK